MKTYRELFAIREFRTLFLASCAGIAGQTSSALALGALTYAATGSALLTALSMFGAPLANVVGSLTLLSAADGVPPRRALSLGATLSAIGLALQAVPGLPLWARFAVILSIGYVGSVTSGARWALISEMLPAGAYVLGRSTMNASVGIMQIAGFGLGGIMLAWLSPYQVFAAATVLAAGSAALVRFGLTERPARSAHRVTVGRTLRVNRALLADRGRRALYLNLWVPNGLIVGCEALFVPYAGNRAGFLFAAGALGMLAGDVGVGRFTSPARRERWIRPLRLLLALPYLAFALHPALPLAVLIPLVASAGYGAALPLQERLIRRCPDEVRGQLLGLANNGMMAGQAVCAALAGLLADRLPVASAIAVLAALSLTAALVLTRGLRHTDPAPQLPVPTPAPESSAAPGQGPAPTAAPATPGR
ncbi:MFS transporter [Plantactinospora siamensis]|uniref:MFS transporter n=1 Tax=Plantactinospora siamensis TaxID=555372 RepID=A0ABV6NYU2_9ACTN